MRWAGSAATAAEPAPAAAAKGGESPWAKLANFGTRLPKPISSESAEKKVSGWLDFLGGSSDIVRTNRALVFFGFAAAMYGNHWFIVTEDAFEIISLAVAARIVYVNAKGPAAEFFAAGRKEILDSVDAGLARHRAKLVERRDKLQTFRDFGSMNASLLGLVRENLGNQARLLELKQRNEKLGAAKTALEARARQDIERKERERRELLDLVNARVLQRLADPAVQERILAQCLADLQTAMKQ